MLQYTSRVVEIRIVVRTSLLSLASPARGSERAYKLGKLATMSTVETQHTTAHRGTLEAYSSFHHPSIATRLVAPTR